MYAVLSPAKRLHSTVEQKPQMQPVFWNESRDLAKVVQGLSSDDLQSLMGISAKLGDLNHERFQKISLEIMQAGLSWRTVLEKKYDICQCFEHFNLKKVASLNADSIEKILSNPKVIRNRKKIQAIIHNANITLKIQQQHGSFSQFLWEHQPKKQNKPFCSPPREAAQLTQSLRQYGWQFIGTTTCYAFMQAAGIINDHDLTCPIRTIIQQKLTKTFTHNPQKTPGLNPINPQANHIDSKKS